jgi:multiple sugar transport system substrate-binding protein
MVLLYRRDVFDRFGLQLPATWSEFEVQARKLKVATSDSIMTDMTLNAGPWFDGLFWQKGGRPFQVDGANIRVNINNAPAKAVLAYWQKLLDDHLLETQPSFTQDWFAALDAGKYAAFPAAAWLLRRLGANAKAGFGQWRVAMLPQWDAGQSIGANWGGACVGVLESSSKKAAAFEFVKWLTHDDKASRLHFDNGLFPVLKKSLQNTELMQAPLPLLGGQPAREIFLKAAQTVDHSLQFCPFQEYVDSIYAEEFSAAGGGKGTLIQAVDRIQSRVVSYATAQGFKVSS